MSTIEIARQIIFILHQADPQFGAPTAEDRMLARRVIQILRQSDPEFARRPQEQREGRPNVTRS